MKARNIIILAVIVIAVIGARIYFHPDTQTKSTPISTAPTNTPVNAPISLLTHTDPTYSIQYPVNWKKTENKGQIIFSSPLESSSDTYQEDFTILITPRVPGTTLEGMSKEYSAMLKKVVTVTDLGETTLSGIPAHKITYSGTLGGKKERKWFQIWIINADKVYTLGYSAEVGKYDANFATIQTMLQSFKITDSTTPASAPLPSPTDALCGNKIVDADENCLTCPADVKCLADYTCSNDGTCLAPASTCGNAKVEGLEKCDDGNLVAGDGCAPNCKKEGFCVPNELLCHSNLARAKCDKYGTDHVAILPCAFYGEGSVCKDGACTE